MTPLCSKTRKVFPLELSTIGVQGLVDPVGKYKKTIPRIEHGLLHLCAVVRKHGCKNQSGGLELYDLAIRLPQ